MTDSLLSFGTLRWNGVQMSLFGHRVPSTPDAIVGYRVGRVTISDPAAIAASGHDIHPALIATGDPSEVVDGEVLELSGDELAAVQRYEEVSFQRGEVQTRFGRPAWAYTPKPGLHIDSRTSCCASRGVPMTAPSRGLATIPLSVPQSTRPIDVRYSATGCGGACLAAG
jgi:hypothetical protein